MIVVNIIDMKRRKIVFVDSMYQAKNGKISIGAKLKDVYFNCTTGVTYTSYYAERILPIMQNVFFLLCRTYSSYYAERILPIMQNVFNLIAIAAGPGLLLDLLVTFWDLER